MSAHDSLPAVYVCPICAAPVRCAVCGQALGATESSHTGKPGEGMTHLRCWARRNDPKLAAELGVAGQ